MIAMKRKSHKNTSSGETQKFGVVLGHIDSKLDHIVEGQHGLGQQIQTVDGKVENLREEMNYKFEVVFDKLHMIRNDPFIL